MKSARVMTFKKSPRQFFLFAISAFCLALTFMGSSSFRRSGHPVEKENSEFALSTASDGINQANKISSTSSVVDVVNAANAFKTLLTSSQISTLQQTFTKTLAVKWSNLPCGSSCRNGIQFGTITSAQLNAAKAIIQAAAGTAVSEGFTEFMQIVTADSLLGTVAGSNYSKNIYFISFLNNPSTTGAWLLQYGGHHVAVNIAFNKGQVIGATPIFEGVELITWTNGLSTGPLANEHSAMTAMLASLTSAQLSTARLSSTFSDVVLGPNQDGNFPATKVGLVCSALTSAQQALVMAAMDPWLNDVDSATAATLRSIYQSEISGTYIAYTGSGTSGSAGSFLNANTNYVRIDGPSVWIEFVCQSGVVFPSQIHYHTVWRDHTRDYGNYLSTSVERSSNELPVHFSLGQNYPNPFNPSTTISFNLSSRSFVFVKVFDLFGREVATVVSEELPAGTYARQWNAAGLASGVYFYRLQAGSFSETKKLTLLR